MFLDFFYSICYCIAEHSKPQGEACLKFEDIPRFDHMFGYQMRLRVAAENDVVCAPVSDIREAWKMSLGI